jgi:predicted AAA+ superfamily ATPase
VLIYATSNRRHLLPEYFSENLETKHIGEEVHPANRSRRRSRCPSASACGSRSIPFAQDDYLAAVERLARALRRQAAGGARDAEARTREALQFALARGSRSGRVAWQFAAHTPARTR